MSSTGSKGGLDRVVEGTYRGRKTKLCTRAHAARILGITPAAAGRRPLNHVTELEAPDAFELLPATGGRPTRFLLVLDEVEAARSAASGHVSNATSGAGESERSAKGGRRDKASGGPEASKEQILRQVAVLGLLIDRVRAVQLALLLSQPPSG